MKKPPVDLNMLSSELLMDNNSQVTSSGFGAYRTRNFTQFESLSNKITTRKQINEVLQENPQVEKIYSDFLSGHAGSQGGGSKSSPKAKRCSQSHVPNSLQLRSSKKSVIKSNKLGGRSSLSALQKQKAVVNQEMRLEKVLRQSRVVKEAGK